MATPPTPPPLGSALSLSSEESPAPERVDLTLPLEEGERQVVLLALARLSVERPGWDYMLNRIARRIDNTEAGRAKLYDGFRELDKAPPAPSGRSPLVDAMDRLRSAALAGADPRGCALVALGHAVGVCIAAGCTSDEVRRWLSAYFGEVRR